MYDDIDLKHAQSRSYWVGFTSGVIALGAIVVILFTIGLKYNI